MNLAIGLPIPQSIFDDNPSGITVYRGNKMDKPTQVGREISCTTMGRIEPIDSPALGPAQRIFQGHSQRAG